MEEASGRHLGGGIKEEGIMEEEASGGGIMEEEASGGGIMKEASWRRHYGGRHHGGGIWRRHLDSSGRHLGAGRHLGGTWEASGRHLGDIWEASGRHLGGSWATQAPGRLPRLPGTSELKKLVPLCSALSLFD